MTSPSGAGRSPAGVSPYGYGTPTTATARGGAALTGDQGKRYSGRKLDPATRQYVYDTNGRAVGESRVHQMVKLVAMTTLGSSALPDLGHDLDSIKDITANFTQRVQAVFATAYSRMVAMGLIELKEVVVSQLPPNPVGVSRASITVKFKNLDTNEDDEVHV